MLRKGLTILLVGCLVLCSVALLQAQTTVVGGHIKMTLFDYKTGESDGESGSEGAGLALREFDLIVAQDINDNISVVALTEFAASTSATPSFGKPIEGKAKDPGDVDMVFKGFREFKVKVNLPKGFELSTGILHPEWSWEYGSKNFWEEEINGSKFGLHHDISALHEGGFEIYKNFELENMSLPAYLWIVNGGATYNDNTKRLISGSKLNLKLVHLNLKRAS